MQGHSIAFSLSESIREQNHWDQCPRCGAFDAYIQKMVPKQVFMGVLVLFLVVAFFLLGRNWYMGMSVLVALALVDYILYRILPDVLVCYDCRTRAHGYAKDARLQPHDHHVAERYRQKRVST